MPRTSQEKIRAFPLDLATAVGEDSGLGAIEPKTWGLEEPRFLSLRLPASSYCHPANHHRREPRLFLPPNRVAELSHLPYYPFSCHELGAACLFEIEGCDIPDRCPVAIDVKYDETP